VAPVKPMEEEPGCKRRALALPEYRLLECPLMEDQRGHPKEEAKTGLESQVRTRQY
jgi:hypothetical protein